jgi:excisionase family DNA binding protein
MESGWFTINEAAALLGVSTTTVRRALKRGEFESRQVSSSHGPTWLIWLERPTGAAAEASSAEQTESPAMVELIRLVASLQAENRNLADQVGFLRAQLQQARRRAAS